MVLNGQTNPNTSLYVIEGYYEPDTVLMGVYR